MPSNRVALLALALPLVACGGHSAATGGAPPEPKVDASVPAADGGPSAGDDAGGPAFATDGGLILITEPDQGMTLIDDFIGTAKKSIDMTMYELTDTTITGILAQAAQKGLTVRVILDQNSEQQANMPAYDTLGDAGVQVHWANPTFAVTHQKTITIDATTSAIMTLNLSSEDYPTSRDFAVITSDVADVAAIETTFAADMTNASITPPTGDDLVWSPTNSLTALEGIIDGATTSLLVENEEMSDYDIVDPLVSAARRGVDVKVVMENSSSYATEFAQLVAGGVKLVTYQHDKLYIHAKIILADYGASGAKCFLGSENFSRASLTENRELGLITSDPGVMGSIETTLSSDFAGGVTYHPDAGAPPSDASGSDDAADAGDAGSSDDAASPDDGASG